MLCVDMLKLLVDHSCTPAGVVNDVMEPYCPINRCWVLQHHSRLGGKLNKIKQRHDVLQVVVEPGCCSSSGKTHAAGINACRRRSVERRKRLAVPPIDQAQCNGFSYRGGRSCCNRPEGAGPCTCSAELTQVAVRRVLLLRTA